MNYVQQFHINGVETRQVACIELKGKPNAATEGWVGVLGIDVTSPLHEVYKCVAVNGSIYSWELLSSGSSIMSATNSGGSAESVQFPYTNLLTPAEYVVKNGDLILDSEGYLYQIIALNTTYCEAKYTGTRVVAYGMSAYELAVRNGFEGSLEEWFASLKGDPGITPHIGENGNWWLGDVDTMESAAGNTPWTLVEKYTTAGSYTWTCPKDGEYVVLIVGGGGSGAVNVDNGYSDGKGHSMSAIGGNCGERMFYRGQIAANTGVPLVVGVGGTGVGGEGWVWRSGYDGGTSSFAGVTASGGTGGKARNTSYDITPSYFVQGRTVGSWDGMELFLDENNIPAVIQCDGCGAEVYQYSSGSTYFYKETVSLESVYLGISASPAYCLDDTLTSVIAEVPTHCGAGSGGIVAFQRDNTNLTGVVRQSAKGADGGVFIYKVRSDE